MVASLLRNIPQCSSPVSRAFPVEDGRAETDRVRKKNYYNDDPGIADIPLSAGEIEELLANPGAVGKRDLPHLLRRVLATTRWAESVRRNYDDELRRRTAALPRSGIPTTLSPEDAVKFLNQEQITRLFDRFSQEKIAALDGLRERAAETEAAARRGRRELASALAETLSIELPEGTRQRVQEALALLHTAADETGN